MEEKKLEYDGFIEVTMENMKNVHLVPTADEVVKVLEECFAKCGEMSCKDCSVYTGNGLRDCMKSVGINALNLIHCLQDEKAELEQRFLEEGKERLKYEQAYNKKCHDSNIGISIQRNYWKKKIVETVKEVLKELYEYPHEYHYKKILEIAKRYGVEVE